MNYALGLFAKWPEPGRVKTRLAADTSPIFAAAIAEAFLGDTLHRLAVVDVRRVLAYAPADAGPRFAEVVGGRFDLEAQTDGDLGLRMKTFFTRQLAAGAEAVVLLGTDSPTLPLAFVELAFRELEQAELVLGPATDGGYYLVGCRRLPPIFDGIAWSRPNVLAQTVARLTDPRWKVALLPPWYDVDTLDDWLMLRGHLTAMQRCGIDPNLPLTLELIRSSPFLGDQPCI